MRSADKNLATAKSHSMIEPTNIAEEAALQRAESHEAAVPDTFTESEHQQPELTVGRSRNSSNAVHISKQMRSVEHLSHGMPARSSISYDLRNVLPEQMNTISQSNENPYVDKINRNMLTQKNEQLP